jgi:hypothetical protein
MKPLASDLILQLDLTLSSLISLADAIESDGQEERAKALKEATKSVLGSVGLFHCKGCDMLREEADDAGDGICSRCYSEQVELRLQDSEEHQRWSNGDR